MGYYGPASRGCHRCRQRKVKCDERKPGCLRCEKTKTQCPGYRNLADVVFHDDTQRVVRKARNPIDGDQPNGLQQRKASSAKTVLTQTVPRTTAISPGTAIILAPLLAQPPEQMAVDFFFVNYAGRGPPYSRAFHSWLVNTCWRDKSNTATRAAIGAVGMAGFCNTSKASHLMSKAKSLYGRALSATNLALRDPLGSKADSTLMAVLTLGLFETVTFENWNHYRSWATHIKGATALFKLRGHNQFLREPGIQLYIQLRRAILLVCLQQGLAVPRVLMESNHLNRSLIEEYSIVRRPVSITKPGFQLANLRAAVKNKQITDPEVIYARAIQIDTELDGWRGTTAEDWEYWAYHDADERGVCFNGRRHVYRQEWAVQIWNDWRAVRILANQLILYHGSDEESNEELERLRRAVALSTIRELSTDICISTASLIGSPLAATLIWPLFVVSREKLNSEDVRAWATKHLREISAFMGVRQAAFLADEQKPENFGRDLSIAAAVMPD